MGICTTEFQFSSCVVEKSKRQNFGKTFRTHGGLLYIVFAKWFKLCSGPCEVENQDSILWNRVHWAILKILNENSEKPQQKVNVVFFYKYIFEFHEIWRVLNFSIAPSQLLLMWTFFIERSDWLVVFSRGTVKTVPTFEQAYPCTFECSGFIVIHIYWDQVKNK